MPYIRRHASALSLLLALCATAPASLHAEVPAEDVQLMQHCEQHAEQMTVDDLRYVHHLQLALRLARAPFAAEPDLTESERSAATKDVAEARELLVAACEVPLPSDQPETASS